MNNIFGKSTSVSDALDTRLTCRSFLDKEINKDIIFDILDKARRAPSGGNLQPWRVWAISGDPLKDMNNMKNIVFVMKEGKVYVDKTNE